MPAATLSLTVLLVFGATVAHAQRVSLDLRNGAVTLDARDATVDDILAEWTRVGGMKVVSMKGERIGGAPVTMLLRDITERQALDMLLRGVSGYLLFARRDLQTGRSTFEQIVIVPTSSAPAAANASAGTRPAPGTELRPFVPASVIQADRRAAAARRDVDEKADDADDTAAETADTVAIAPGDVAEAVSDQPGNQTPASAARADRDAPPPTPLLPPPTAPDAGNPFGRPAASSRPGGITTGPPEGVVYPPVTNPNLGTFKPAGTP